MLLLYNTDYDEELIEASNTDVSAVQEAAAAVCDAVNEYGIRSDILGVHGLDLAELFVRLREDPPDLVFNLVESLNGSTKNEMVVPSVLDMLGIPYTGPNPLSIGLCLHKDRCKDVLVANHISTPDYVVLGDAELDADRRARLDDLAYPFFLKLSREDASIGIEAANVVGDPEALLSRAHELIRAYRQPVIAERYIEGREVNVTVLGNGAGAEVLPLHEIDFAKMPPGRPRIVSYAAKWDEDHVDYAGTKPVPMVDVSPEVEAAIKVTALEAFGAVELRDFGRVDLRVDSEGTPWVIDINPNCDLSPDAGVARTASAAGLSYPSLVGRICEIAWSRHVCDDSNIAGE